MKRLFYIIVVAFAMICPLQSCANGGGAKTEVSASEPAESVESVEPAESAKKPGYKIRIEGLLKDAKQQKSSTNFPLFFARQFLDVPYVAHTLEVNDEERLVINTDELDCTTLVETVTALTLCAYRKSFTFLAYQQALQAMRYRNGVIDRYPSRIHYFTDWIAENTKAGIVTEIQQPNPPFTQIQTVKVNYMSQHPQSYKALKAHPEYVAEIAQMEQRLTGKKFRFIPKSEVKDTPAMREAVHDGDIIAITCNMHTATNRRLF